MISKIYVHQEGKKQLYSHKNIMKQLYHISLPPQYFRHDCRRSVCFHRFFNECIWAHTNVSPSGCELESFWQHASITFSGPLHWIRGWTGLPWLLGIVCYICLFSETVAVLYSSLFIICCQHLETLGQTIAFCGLLSCIMHGAIE